MRVMNSAARVMLGVVSSACCSAVAAQDTFRIVRHELVVDVPRGEAVFDLWFSRVPDFETYDELGREAYAFQFYLEQPDVANFNRRLNGAAERDHPYVIHLR